MDTPDPLPRVPGAAFRRRGFFRHRMIPVRFLAPNLFTLLSLCAGVTAIRAAIEQRWELAVALIVAAALLDGVDGQVARALKAQSRFGAELDSLADFCNFGVAPAIVLFTWGLGGLKGLGWIAVLLFACAMSLRLARFNSALDVDKPRWHGNYFTGMPAPAGAITVLLPFYLEGVGLIDLRQWPLLIAIYVFVMAGLLVSTIPTFAAKLIGERIAREYVAPVLVSAALLVGVLVTYPYATLTTLTLLYLAVIPWSYRRFQRKQKDWLAGEGARAAAAPVAPPPAADAAPLGPNETRH